MEYSSEKVMTRKEYLNSKKKGKFGFRFIKYTLLLIVIVLLGVYLFEQLNIYNNVTKIANKVVEETALARTMTMYYVADGYTKDSKPVVTLYRASDASRTKLEATDGFENIKIAEGRLYGVVDDSLCYIDLETNEKVELFNQNVKEYHIKGDKIYFYSEFKETKNNGIYVYDSNTKKIDVIVNITAYQLLLDDSFIYVVSKGKTEKSVVRYNLNGSGRTVLSNKEIVTYIKQDNNNIYFVSDNHLYRMNKSGNNTTRLLEDEIYVDSDLKTDFSAESIFGIKDEIIYYMNKSEDNVLCAYNLKNSEKQTIIKKSVESLQIVDNILYFKLNNELELYKVNLETGKYEKVTSIRGTEYICIN